MEDLYVYTPEFELLHIENRLTSVQWTECFQDVGKTEIHTDAKSDLVRVLLANKDAVLVQGDKSAMVMGITDVRGNLDFGVYGKSLSFLLSKRVVQPFTMRDTVENIIVKKVGEAFESPGDRYLSIRIDSNLGDTSKTTYTTEEAKTLLDIVKALCEPEKLGFSLQFEPVARRYVFRLYRGTDRSAGQWVQTPLFFSEDERNFAETQYTYNAEQYASCGYRKLPSEDGETTSYKEVIKEAQTGFYRRECILPGETEEDAVKELSEKKCTEVIEGTAHNVVFGRDYGLGDIVTVQKMIGNTLVAKNKRVKEVWRVFESLNTYERPTLEEV